MKKEFFAEKEIEEWFLIDYTKKENPIMGNILLLLTPTAIGELSFVYKGLARIPMTSLLENILKKERVELGIKRVQKPPLFFDYKKFIESEVPSIIRERVTGGSSFVLQERERLLKSKKRLEKMEIISLYQEMLEKKPRKSKKKDSLGILIDKKGD